MPNTLDFNQAAEVLNTLQYQVTGQKGITPTNTSEFVAVAQSLLLNGYDPILNALSQVISRTIFSVRPYYRKFLGLETEGVRWGNITRKISFGDKELVNDQRFEWPVAYDSTQTTNPYGDGVSVDMYTISKTKVMQTNFYGQNVYQYDETIFRDQLDAAFHDAAEFGRFYGALTMHRSNVMEQYRESTARLVLANLIAGVLAENNPNRVVKLLTEYNTATGQSYTSTSILEPANWKAFTQWAYARIAALTAMMTERTTLFQTTINDFVVNRHTPYDRQKVYLATPVRVQMEMMALADIYHDTFLRMADNENVNYWQSPEHPLEISITPVTTNATGAAEKATTNITQDNIFGVIFDEEAAGYAILNYWSLPTPFNTHGGYWNITDHANVGVWTDFTEKAVVLLLEETWLLL